MLKSVSFVMPVLNEERYLAAAVRSIFEQELDGEREVVLAIAPSHDRTEEIARELAKTLPIQIVANPSGNTSAALNAAIKVAKHEVVLRVDAHSKLSPGYAKLAIQILNETGADNVGGIMRAVGETPFQRAVAYAYNSPVGLGSANFHVGGQAGRSDSVYLGVFRKTAFEKYGFFDEKAVRGQDWQLNRRINDGGGMVWFDPRLEVQYLPRSNVKRLANQFYNTGLWRAQLVKQYGGSVRYLIPPALVLSSILLVPAALYLLAIAIFALLVRKPLLFIVLPTMHYSWGFGFLVGSKNKPER